jgi:amidase
MLPFNRLTTTVFELQDLLQDGKTTSFDALSRYLRQLDAHNSWLKAVIATPGAYLLLERAELLDDERRQGKVRGPLHGIPILIKVSTA